MVKQIKDYTTDVPAVRTVAEIEAMLIGFGADKIMKDYRGDGRVAAFVFKYQDRLYRLPSNTEKAAVCLQGAPGHSKRLSLQEAEARAERVTWRVIKDWLDAQISMMKIGQAEVEQVMLPYMWDGKTSLYEKFKQRDFALTGDKK